MNLRLSFALTAGKAAQGILHLTGSGATALPGLITYRLAPKALTHLAAQCDEGIVLVSGTNGKTTTCRLIAAILESSGKPFIHNRSGSNMTRGHISAFLTQTGPSGHVRARQALLEVDEAVFPSTLEQTKPTVVVLHNVFRDQLDRYGEVDSIVKKWKEALVKYLPPESTLIINADDPNLAYLGETLGHPQTLYYGLDDESVASREPLSTVDAFLSPATGAPLQYEYYYVSHLGKYHDAGSDFARPALCKAATKIHSTEDGVRFSLEDVEYSVALPGLYNVYNYLAAISTAQTLGYSNDQIKAAAHNLEGAFGRFERVERNGQTVTFCLIKNPAGAAEVLRTIAHTDRKKPLALAIMANDKFADGLDVSWYWDTPFEVLGGKVTRLLCGGNRAFDMALRCKYAGVSTDWKVLTSTVDVLSAIDDMTVRGEYDIYVLTTYTATIEVQSELKKLGWKKASWH
jgi:UDP-N-acetylmuramyl tripeptide synthase